MKRAYGGESWWRTWVAEAGTYDQRSATMRSVNALFRLGLMRQRVLDLCVSCVGDRLIHAF